MEAVEIIEISLMQLVASLSNLMDFVGPVLFGHHKRTSYISYRLAKEIGLSSVDIQDIIIAALLHDIGVLSSNEQFQASNFEFEDAERHAELGSKLLENFGYFKKPADIIHYHHTHWSYGLGKTKTGGNLPLGSRILFLADRIDVLIKHSLPFAPQSTDISNIICSNSGEMFDPNLVDTFVTLAAKNDFWQAIEQMPSTLIDLKQDTKIR